MPITKPSVQRPWAEGGQRTPIPSDGRRNTGYVLNDIPTRAELNALLFEVTEAYRYLMKVGVSEWDANETYAVGDTVRDPTDLRIYQLRTLTGIVTSTRPGALPANWSQYGALMKPDIDAFTFPHVTFNDALNRQRFAIDHYGLPAGQIREWQEVWDKDVGATFGGGAKWTQTLNGGAMSNRDPGASSLDALDFRGLMVQGAPTVASCWFQETNFSIRFHAGTLAVIEAAIALDTVGSNDHLFRIGVSDAFDSPTRGVYVEKAESDTHWQFTSAELGSIDAGTAPVANAYQRMRIELIGSSVADSGGNSLQHLFINGSHVATHTSGITAGSNLKIMFGGRRTTLSGLTVRGEVGPIRYRQAMFPTLSVVY